MLDKMAGFVRAAKDVAVVSQDKKVQLAQKDRERNYKSAPDRIKHENEGGVA
jgi:hypothetical protein